MLLTVVQQRRADVPRVHIGDPHPARAATSASQLAHPGRARRADHWLDAPPWRATQRARRARHLTWLALAVGAALTMSWPLLAAGPARAAGDCPVAASELAID